MLAPPDAPGRRPRAAPVDATRPPAPTTTAAAPPSPDFWSSTTSFASQLLSHFRVPAFAAASPDAVLRAASNRERELQSGKAPLDVSAFLTPVGLWEARHIRRLSSLTGLTYYMHRVTPRRLLLSHGLELVTTSRACDIRPYEHNRTAEEVGADGDGMAVSMQAAWEVYQSLQQEDGPAAAPRLPGSSNIVALPRELSYQVVPPPAADAQQATAGGGGGGPSWPVPSSLLGGPAATAGGGQAPQQEQQQQQGQQLPMSLAAAPTVLPRMLRTPAEVVAVKLSEAAAAASAAAAGSPLASAAESFYASLASLPMSSGFVGASPPPPLPASTVAGGGGGGAADGAAAYPGFGSRKATAASIAAMATDQIRQQTIRGAAFGRGGGGMASVSSNGLLSSAAAGAASSAVSLSSSSSSSSTSLTTSSVGSPLLGCPSEWFVVDDAATHTRVFSIQGSDTLDHWKLNLTMDPVTFEDPELGVKVHRGVYEAALALYDRFLPLVYEHLESSPFSKIAFTGHSIGGSLATLLMLMYRCRGVLPPHSIATVYTFGSPAVFCQTTSHSHGAVGAAGVAGAAASFASASPSSVPCPPSGSTSWVSPSLWSSSLESSSGSASSVSSYEDAPLASPPSAAAPSAGHSHGGGTGGCAACACGADLLLSRLHLPPQIVCNVIMARDIVPRAFACDYRPMAELLRGWGASFREHCCLNRQGRSHLYYFVGRMCILQPDSWHSFATNDANHPMLPPGPELFAITDAPAQPPPPPKKATAVAAAAAARGGGGAAGAARPAARSVTEAIWELMDRPHPLEMLADPGAYLNSGSISRYHNPENYTRALGRITHLKRQAERRSDKRPPPKAPAPASRLRHDSGDGSGGSAPASAAADVAATAAVPRRSSEGLDRDRHLVASAYAAADAHARR